MSTQEEAVTAVYKYAAELVKGGLSAPQVKNRLVENGLDPSSASIVAKNIFAVRTKAIQNAAKRNMLYGALWCMGGTLVTVLTFSMAGGGGRFVIAWGAIIFGAIQFFKGLIQYAKP